jgi:predicted TIM-barrel fold metal-dependent hydrolase
MMPAVGSVPIVDTMIGFARDPRARHEVLLSRTADRQSRDKFAMPAEYMFKDVPEKKPVEGDPIAHTLAEMDRWGIRIGMISVGKGDEADVALKRHPERFVGSFSPDPTEGVEAIRKLRRAHAEHGIRAVTIFPAGFSPQVPIDHRLMYPIYSACVELGLPAFVNVGIPGPRVKSDCQHIERVEEVLFDFPDLVFVMRHGAEPWVEHAVKLMVKWPNLHYSTSAFAPRYYPKAMIDYANTRGAERFVYAGYFPFGLSLERIMTEMRDLPLKDEVWPKFLSGNSARILGLKLG